MKTKLKKVLNVIIDILVIFVMIVSVFVVISSLTTKSSGVPSIFGYAPLSVQSNSMEPTFSEGDLIISEVTVQEFSRKYEVGDVITFPIKIDDKEVLNSHRIVEVASDESISYYKTQGDNKETNPEPDEELVSSTEIVAKWTGIKIPKIGGFLSFIRTQLGFFLCVLLPMIIFFVYEAIRVILNLMAYNKEKAIEEAQAAVESSDLTEEQKQRAIAEYLAQQNASQENEPAVQTPAAGENPEAEDQT